MTGEKCQTQEEKLEAIRLENEGIKTFAYSLIAICFTIIAGGVVSLAALA